MNGILLGMMGLNITNITWILLWFVQISVTLYVIKRFHRDNDLRKAMFGIAFILLFINHVYFGLITPFQETEISLIAQQLVVWSFFPILGAMGLMVHSRFLFKISSLTMFKLFLIFTCGSFFLVVFNPVFMFSLLVISVLSIEIFGVACYNLIQSRSLNDFIVLVIIACLSVGGFFIPQQNHGLSIFSLLLANIFIILLFTKHLHPKTGQQSASFFQLQDELNQTKKELIDQEAIFQTLFHEMADPVVILDRKGTFLEITNQVKEITGFEKEELLGKNFMTTKLLTRKAKMVSMANLMKRLSGAHIPPYEITCLKKDGTPFPVEINARKITYKGKTADMVVLRDITERKQMQKDLIASEQKYHMLFNNLRDGLAKVNMQGTITECNAAFEKMLGYKFSELQQLSYTDITPKNWHTIEQEIIQEQVLQRGYSDLYKKEYRRKNGQVFPVELTTYLIKGQDEQAVGMWAIVRDISDQEAYQWEIQELNKNLEEKVKQRTQEVESLLEQKNEFIHLLAHDLKNPLTTPITLLPILKKQIHDEKQQEFLDVSLRNIKKMKELIDETLALARIDDASTLIQPKSIDLSSFIQDVIQDNQDLLNTYGFHIESHVPSSRTIWADTFQLKEVMTNLLSNAIKYSDESDDKVIIIHAHETENEMVISVTDHGQGIPADQQEKLFQKFYKTGSPREGMNSTGLGLSLCKTIIEKHGGIIWAESQGPGMGSTFSFSLPKNKETTVQLTDTNQEIVSDKVSSLHQAIDELINTHS